MAALFRHYGKVQTHQAALVRATYAFALGVLWSLLVNWYFQTCLFS